MPATFDVVTVSTAVLKCDNIHCGREQELTYEEGGDDDEALTKAGWRRYRDPRLDMPSGKPRDILTFHTQKCALGWFRTLVTGKDVDSVPRPEDEPLEQAMIEGLLADAAADDTPTDDATS
jgi:hypothetical protein